jgi:hypothetical protein
MLDISDGSEGSFSTHSASFPGLGLAEVFGFVSNVAQWAIRPA